MLCSECAVYEMVGDHIIAGYVDGGNACTNCDSVVVQYHVACGKPEQTATVAGHSLCRECYGLIKGKDCPFCKEPIIEIVDVEKTQ